MDGDTFVNENGDVTLEKGDDENQWTYSAPGISEVYEVETYYDQECWIYFREIKFYSLIHITRDPFLFFKMSQSDSQVASEMNDTVDSSD